MSKVWSDFCDGLKLLGEVIEGVEGLNDLDRAEGYRYLTRLLRLALEMNLEHSSAEHASFYSLSHETAKIGGDNPDNFYQTANVNAEFDYEIVGDVGTVPYLSFGSKENRYSIDGRMISTGEVDLSDLEADADGSIRILVSKYKHDGNWLPLGEKSNMVLVRQTFNDRRTELPARLTIRRINSDGNYDLLDMDLLREQLERSIAFVAGTAWTFVGWVDLFKTGHFNTFDLGDQSFFQAAGGDPNICYIYAYWELAGDEVIQIRSKVPNCDYWNIQLTNVWMESLDYRFYPVHLNNASAELDDDGYLTLHISHRPLNMKNNLVTTGHEKGLLLLRWVGATEHPIPDLVRLNRSL